MGRWRLAGLIAVLAVAMAPAAPAVDAAATTRIVLAPAVSDAQIVQAPAGIEGPVAVTVSGQLVETLQGKPICYDAFYYTDVCNGDWFGRGIAVFIGAGPRGCQAAACMGTVPFSYTTYPAFNPNHVYALKLNPGAGAFWAYPFKGRPISTWSGSFTLDFGAAGGAGTPDATLGSIQGDVAIARDGGTFQDASPGDELAQGDDISTGPDGSATLKLPDGSTITLEPNTQITLASLIAQKDDIRARMNLAFGKIAAKVNKSEAAESDYSVRTPTATASVRGTIFSVFFDPVSRAAVISVTKGIVSVDPVKKRLPTKTVPAGKEVEVTAGAISSLAAIGKAGARGGVNRVTARDLVLKAVRGSLARCGLTMPHDGAPFSVSPVAAGWKVSLLVTGPLRGWATWTVAGRKVTAANALAKTIVAGCPGVARVRPGHYAGQTKVGGAISFDVPADGKGVAAFRGQSDVSCAGGDRQLDARLDKLGPVHGGLDLRERLFGPAADDRRLGHQRDR